MHDRASAATALLERPAPLLQRRSAAESVTTPTRRCPGCGYNLHGLPIAAVCPECGHDPAESALPRSSSNADVWWARSVVAGLCLLLGTSFLMLGVTVYMHFRSEWAGSLPVLNFPGPKLWGAALLQRSVGNAPGEWGVAGTRFGLLGLVAIWLITAPRPADRFGEAFFSIRRCARWVSLLGFGAMLGLLLGEDGVDYWESKDRDTYFLLLLSVVELPATTLLYVYLRQLALSLRDGSIRQSMNILAVAVPACIGGAVIIMLLGGFWQQAKHQFPQQVMVAGYGAACVALAALATATLGRIALVLAPATIGGAQRIGLRQFVLDIYRQAKLRALTQSEGWYRWLAVAGLIGWVYLSVGMLQTVLNLEFRTGPGGNWPMVNVVGPKVWGVPLVVRLGGWYVQASEAMGGLLLMLGCFWLITVRRPGAPGRESWCSQRRLARWGTTCLVGAAVGIVVGFGRDGAVVQTHSILSAFTLPLTMFVEGPATLLLYLYLAVLARGQGDGRLARHLSWAGLLSVTLIVGGNGLFLMSRLGLREGPIVFLVTSGYGLACVAVGLWATWSVFRLVRALALPPLRYQYEQLSLFEKQA